MAFNRRDFLRGLFFTGATAVVAPTKLVQVAVGFDQKPGGGIVTKFSDPYAGFWAKHSGFASDITEDEIKAINSTLFDKLASDPCEEAIDAVNSFTRMAMRGDGFFRRIVPPLRIEKLFPDRSVPTYQPVKSVYRDAALRLHPNRTRPS